MSFIAFRFFLMLSRAGRSMGHAAVNPFSRGCRQLEEGKLKDFISTTTCLGDFLEEIARKAAGPPQNSQDDEMRSDSPTPSSSNSDHTSESDHTSNSDPASDSGSVSSSNSLRSNVSRDSILSSEDPNEPGTDGVDMSDTHRSSGSYVAMYVDQETGMLEHEEEDKNEVGIEKEELDEAEDSDGPEELSSDSDSDVENESE
ncbi:hypothetical protein FB451DRAFT_1194684 [Mycena latifolia]|nr:hypothetical protein FB451DRAFT_1194684 [Mycena latifolia]